MSISKNQAVVHFEGELEEGWQELTEAEFLALPRINRILIKYEAAPNGVLLPGGDARK